MTATRTTIAQLLVLNDDLTDTAGKSATRAILASALEMARKLKLTSVAKGVETQENLDLVRGLGCDLVQGWFVARAMSLDGLLTWLRARQKIEKPL